MVLVALLHGGSVAIQTDFLLGVRAFPSVLFPDGDSIGPILCFCMFLFLYYF